MRDAPRLHVTTELSADRRVTLDDDRRHYLRHVMRHAAGDPVRLFNARDGEWRGTIVAAPRDAMAVQVVDRLRPPLAAPPGPTLLFAPLKRDATDLVIRMATELGAGVIAPLLTERTITGRVNLDRLRSIAREAAEQCERLDLPDIEPPDTLDVRLDRWPPDQPIAAAVERSQVRRLGSSRPAGARKPAALLVGPEGGFTRQELDAMTRRPFVEPVSLGDLVLRAETACAVGLALLLSERLERDVKPG